MTRSPKIWTLLRYYERRLRRKQTLPSAKGNQESRLDKTKTAVMVFTIFALSVLMSVHLLPAKIGLKARDIAPQEIRANRSVIYFDSVQTARQQRANELNTPPVYARDDNAITDAERATHEYFNRIEDFRNQFAAAKPNPSLANFLHSIPPYLRADYTEAQLSHLLTLSPAVFQKLKTTATRLVSEAMEGEIRDQNHSEQPANDLAIVRQSVAASAKTLFASPLEAEVIRSVAEQAIRPNRLLNRPATQLAREKARRDTPPIYNRITLGDKIIGAGQVVTQEHLDKFTALGMLNPRFELTTSAAVSVLAALMVILVAFTIARTLPALYADTRRLALLSVIVLLSVFGLKVGATLLGLQFSSGQLGYLGMSSVAAAGMLVCVLIDAHLAVLIVALLSVQSGLIMNHEIRFTVMTLMGSLIGIACVNHLRRRSNLPLTATALSVSNVGMAVLLGVLLNDTPKEIVAGSGWAIGSAVFATFLFWSGILLLEKPFGILTHTTLLELSQFDRPLLQQLCAVAPGTYAHSIMVGTLAEAGANAVGANGLLARVGGYYHDIGKMQRPGFFVENQRSENVHGRLSPSLSALIITAHVRDGIEMAKEHRLPTEIRDIIAQHHGTTLIRYFYHQALADCGGAEEAPPGLEERFRYPGPKPQTRESAVVMMADTIEAATRTLDKPSPERLEAMLHALVHEKLEDGQLDECDLTFRDIKAITDAFLHVLRAMMHERIDYPQMPKNATGRPMEVIRPDLRPEPHSNRLPSLAPNAAQRALDAGAAVGVELTGDEAKRDIEAHLSSEILYASAPTERANASRQDDRTSQSGSPTP